jgi:hypothetical protein
MTEVRYLNEFDLNNYISLLKENYLFNEHFQVKVELFQIPNVSLKNVLGVFENNELVATMKLEYATNEILLQKMLCTDLKFDFLKFPIAILSRGATTKSRRNQGYNSLLRYYFIKSLLQQNITFLFGTMIKDTPRVHLLRKLGYTIIENNRKWSGYFNSDLTALICYLDLKKDGTAALDELRKTIPIRMIDHDFESFQP